MDPAIREAVEVKSRYPRTLAVTLARGWKIVTEWQGRPAAKHMGGDQVSGEVLERQ